MIPFVPRRPEQILPYAALVEWTAAHALWQGQATLIEPHQGFVYAAGAGFRVPTGLGVTLMPLRNPYEAALQVRSLAMATGEPVVAGFGPGPISFQESLLGERYRSQLGAIREYVTAVRGLLDGGVVDVHGEYVQCKAMLPPAVSPPIEIGLGVLRTNMARLAGEVADVAITWLTPVDYLAGTVMPALREGAEKAGRPAPRLAAMVPLAMTRPDRTPTEQAMASNALHLQAPHYVDMLRKAGLDVTGKDPAADAKAAVAGGAFLSGDLDELVAALKEYERVGADEIILNLTGVFNLQGQKEAMNELKALLGALVGGTFN
ncbi:LLM class flavin-dependent oxidoreductase [Nonomuraea sp. PA05]|uniref:LLM class flavin-dependent oxidoreductase n=1 Tax=Nonomuraea sp. PA05 TaxID=2604466 RepID=UPI0016523D85|nr:LLM class flavin-dependent oxidoreductase [Nonomuraea sp. PA05]